MDPDAVVKLILALSVGASLLMISFQIARLIGSSADILKDSRKVVQNVGNISDKVVEDYEELRKVIKNVTQIISGFASVFGPISALIGFFASREKAPAEAPIDPEQV